MTESFAPGVVAGVYAAPAATAARPDFLTASMASLKLDLSGIPGDLHAGATRKAGAREPWLPRGAVLRNDRQLSALCAAELAAIGRRLGLPELRPEWLGGNLLVEGLAGFSRIAPGSRLAIGGDWRGKGRFDGKAVLRVEAYNKPCRQVGRTLAELSGRPDLEFAFVREAATLRGLVLSVDLAGEITPGDAVVVIAPLVPAKVG
jgi:hypothetical protein